MGTYTLAFADGVLFACVPDEADIASAITEATATNYGFGIALDIVRGAELTDAACPDDDVVWCETSDSELTDREGRCYRYAVRRAA